MLTRTHLVLLLLLMGVILTAVITGYSRIVSGLREELRVAESESEMKDVLNDGLEDYIEEDDRLGRVEDYGREEIDAVAEERPEDEGQALPRMRRADSAWRSTLECLYDPSCADPNVGSVEELPEGGDPDRDS